MNRQLHLLTALAATALGTSLLAQTPSKPPPWWGVQDDVTVSLYWDFSGPAPFTPQEIAVPTWYNNPVVVTQAVPTGPLAILPVLAGHTDVLALVGNNTLRTARLDVTVDNDPHVDWVKVFWFQFDEFEGAAASVIEAIEQDLAQYKKSSVTTKTESLGQGWNRVTVTAQLVPQPGDEGVDFAFTTAALGNAAIDNLFVNSKCIKLDDSDQDGDAMGDPDGFTVNLTAAVSAATGISTCLAAAVTEGPAPGFARTYWISGLAPSLLTAHQLIRIDETGSFVSSTLLPGTLATIPNGASDLAVERVVASTGTIVNQFLYAVVDQRSTGLANVALFAFDTNGGPVPGRNVFITAPFPANFPPGPHSFGLAFNPSGQQGLGTFLLTDQFGNAFEFSRAGVHQRTSNNLPLGVSGAGYDDVFGNYYWFSNAPVATPGPGGNVHVNGYEWSAYDMQPTGTRFFGNLNLNPGGTRGGIAAGFDVYRRDNGDFRALCVVQLTAPNRSVLYELKGPFRWGASLAGTCGMRGLPFEGSPNFEVTLSGVPTATFAALYAGFTPRTPVLNLSTFGMAETNVLINLNMNSTLQAPSAPGSGEFAFTVPLLPPGSGFSYVPMFFQWVVFDPTVPAGVTLSPGGKTLIY